jgi:hypothetical protein
MKPYQPEELLETIHKVLEINGSQAGQKDERTTGVAF